MQQTELKQRSSFTPDFVAVLIAIAPFATVYLAHFFSWNGDPTGFIHEDMPYYVANGREIFERGNGFAYANPYDPSPNAPVIYFHWLILLLGIGTQKLGLEPGAMFVALGAMGGLAMSWLTLKLVQRVLPRTEYARELFVATMWGGGFLCFGQFIMNLRSGAAPGENLLAFDPGNGLWFLNWGRNLVFPTEAVYHALVAACWLSELKGKHWLAIFFGALLAATHPWSGLEVIGTLAAYWALRMLFDTTQTCTRYFIASLACVAAFLWYNMVYLPSFAQHAALQETWKLAWRLEPISIALAWLPIACLTYIRVVRDRKTVGWNEAFLALAFGVAFSLSIHDRFMRPTQPLHFTRGYVFMPLVLLSLPLIQDAVLAVRQRVGVGVFAFAGVFAVGVLSFDNAVFLSAQVNKQQRNDAAYFLTDSERDVLNWIRENNLESVALSENANLGYLSATYTALRPYVGHFYNTPHRTIREEQRQAFFNSNGALETEWLNSIECVIASTETADRLVADGAWKPVYRNQELCVLTTAGNAKVADQPANASNKQ